MLALKGLPAIIIGLLGCLGAKAEEASVCSFAYVIQGPTMMLVASMVDHDYKTLVTSPAGQPKENAKREYDESRHDLVKIENNRWGDYKACMAGRKLDPDLVSHHIEIIATYGPEQLKSAIDEAIKN